MSLERIKGVCHMLTPMINEMFQKGAVSPSLWPEGQSNLDARYKARKNYRYCEADEQC